MDSERKFMNDPPSVIHALFSARKSGHVSGSWTTAVHGRKPHSPFQADTVWPAMRHRSSPRPVVGVKKFQPNGKVWAKPGILP